MKSSSDAGGDPGGTPGPGGGQAVAVATSLRLRGVGGRLTASLVPGGIDQFSGRSWALVGGYETPVTRQEIETYAIYGRKVVVKFKGVDTAADAARFEGLDILVPCKGLVDLPEGAYYIFELVGMRVRTRAGRDLGVVRRVIETGGAPLLAIEEPGAGRKAGDEMLVPAARSICTDIDRAAGTITIDPPEGLLEL